MELKNQKVRLEFFEGDGHDSHYIDPCAVVSNITEKYNARATSKGKYGDYQHGKRVIKVSYDYNSDRWYGMLLF